jgi:DNA polymerase-3 subunit beta
MQLVKTERDTLRPLQTVSGIVERRHTLPILANLLITRTARTFLSCRPTWSPDHHARRIGVGGDQVATTVAPASCWTSCARCLTATSRCRSPTSG